MNKILASLIFLSISTTAFAHTAFVGTVKGTGAVCVIEIEQTYYENNIETPENFRADVAVSLDDGDDHLKHEGELTFAIKPSGKPQILSGVGENQKDLINVLTSVGSTGLEAPVSFALKWLHGTHFHTAQCLNLVKADHE